MRRLFGVVCFSLLTGCAIFAQRPDTLSVDFHNMPLEVILDSISSRTGYFFSYNATALPTGSAYSYTGRHVSLDQLLKELLKGTDLCVTRLDDEIILKRKDEELSVQKQVFMVSGSVKNALTGEPVAGVHIYLNGSTIGTYSNEKGQYILNPITPGSYQLIFSHVGFQSVQKQLDASTGRDFEIDISLAEQVTELPEIEITSRKKIRVNEDTSGLYTVFKKEFLGSSPNADHCEFLNPQVVHFMVSGTDHFQAFADEPLWVRNESLGYEVAFELVRFEHNEGQTSLQVNAHFYPIEAPLKRMNRKWERHRMHSYQGSCNHFFRALVDNTLEEEGFELYEIENMTRISLDDLRPVSRDELVSKGQTPFVKKISSKNFLMVVYTKGREHQAQPVNPGAPNSDVMTHQKSFVFFKNGSLEVFDNGQVADPADMIISGYWQKGRMADLVPIDFQPKKSVAAH